MKTLAELKRDAQSGKISFELVERFGDTGNAIPERLRDVRKVSRVNSVAIILLNSDGVESEMRLDNAKLVEYDGETLTLYNPGRREPTDDEKKVLEEAEEIKKKHDKSYDCGYWALKDYFEKCACPWMSGFDSIGKRNGKKYETWSGKVIDHSINGNAILKYKVYPA